MCERKKKSATGQVKKYTRRKGIKSKNKKNNVDPFLKLRNPTILCASLQFKLILFFLSMTIVLLLGHFGINDWVQAVSVIHFVVKKLCSCEIS